MSRVAKRRSTSPSAPTTAVSHGVNAAKEPAASQGTVGWSGDGHDVTPVASEGAPRFPSWSKRLLVCRKVQHLR